MPGLPTIKAKNYLVMNMKTKQIFHARYKSKPKQIASLTKIMTLYCCLLLEKEFKINTQESFVQCSQNAYNLGGTTACLSEGDQLKVEDLYYGMMLPSGNDAAYTLAEFYGGHLRLAYQYGTYNKKWHKSDPGIRRQLRRSLNCFLYFMNREVRKLKMKNTNFVNSHGLANAKNYSTVEDMSLLCIKAWKVAKFRKICQTKFYWGRVK